MAWYDTKQAAVDPDNPAANEQIPFSEWNAMVTYLKDKIIDKAVNDAAIANNRVLVYKTATSTFVFEDQSAVAAINDLTDVVISGVPADNEVLAYNTATSKWINQTAAEAALATTTDLASYVEVAGDSMQGTFDLAGYTLEGLSNVDAYGASGMLCRSSTDVNRIYLAHSTYAFYALADATMNSNKIVSVTDPTSAQDAATKNYADTRVATKELVTNFTNDYVLIYKTASGKFEMEEQSAALGLPVVDTTAIIKGSADGTKQARFEVDGLTSGTTRVLTIQDKDYTIADRDEVLLNPATADINMAGFKIDNVDDLESHTYLGMTHRDSGSVVKAIIATTTYAFVAYATVDMHDHVVKDLKNSVASALSGTQKDIEIDIGGTAYYFTVYPTKA